MNPLFTPFRVRNITLPNRIVMAPMTRGQSPAGIPGPEVAAYYRRRAQQGVGLIITEGTGIDHPAALGGMVRGGCCDHGAGGRIMPQLWHVGMARQPGSFPNPEAPPVGPSGLTGGGVPVVVPLAEREIADLVTRYHDLALSSWNVI